MGTANELKKILHYIFFVLYLAVLYAPLRFLKRTHLYAVPFLLTLVWLVCDDCPLNEKQKDGSRKGDIVELLRAIFPFLSTRRARMLFYSMVIGSLTVLIFRCMRRCEMTRLE